MQVASGVYQQLSALVPELVQPWLCSVDQWVCEDMSGQFEQNHSLILRQTEEKEMSRDSTSALGELHVLVSFETQLIVSAAVLPTPQ